MKSTYKLFNRDGDTIELKRIGNTNNYNLLIISESSLMQIIYLDNQKKIIKSIDPSGGPMIKIGLNEDENGDIFNIKSINWKKNVGYIIKIEHKNK